MADGQDTEITLGTGRLLGLFFGLVVICGVFFGLGFSLGRNSAKSGLTLQETPAASTPEAVGGPKTAAGTPQRALPVDTSATQNSPTQLAPAPSVVPSATSTGSGSPAPEMSSTASSTAAGGYTVQVAAVSKQEDAEALVDALKRKSYPVFIASAASDKLFHIQVGPFADVKDAEAIKAKLLGDGYNPIVKR